MRSLTLRITLLGPPLVEIDGRPLIVDTRKAVALLAYVAVVGRPVARDSLAELLWPESLPEDGRGALRRTLSVLRRGLAGAPLRVDRHQVALEGDEFELELDVRTFRRAVRAASHVHERNAACATCRTSLNRAASLYRADFLEGFSLRDSAPFDEWQALEAEALRAELAAVLRRLVGLESAEGRTAEAVTAARRLIALDALDEAAHRSLMRLLAGAGDAAAAVRQYRTLAATLERELGVTPAPETDALHASIVAGTERRVATARRPGSGRAALAGRDLELLRAAAVVGETFDPDLVRDAAGLDDGDAAAAFERLVAAGWLLEPGTTEGAGELRFADADVRDAVVDEIGVARRRLLHRKLAAAYRDRIGDAGDHVVLSRIATHLARAGAPAEAAVMHQRAAEAAAQRSAHDGVVTNLRAALALGAGERVRLLAALGEAETFRGRYGEALSAYEEAAALADADEVAHLEHALGALHLRRGALELADLHLGAALARLGDEPSVLRAGVLADRSLVAIRRDDIPAANRLARASLRVARATGDAASESQAENLLAMLARRRGAVDTARRHLRRSVERAGVAPQPGARIAALNHLALLERAVGNLDDALALTDEALRRCALLGDRHREAALRNNRADLLHALGRGAEAAEELVRSVTAFAEVGDQRAHEPSIWKLVDW